MSVTGQKYDTKSGVRKVTLTSNPQINPLSNTAGASQNYYCLGFDQNGFQYQIDLQALPAGVVLDQIQQNQVWWVEKRTTLYRLYLYAGLFDPNTRQIDSTASLPAATNNNFNNVTVSGISIFNDATILGNFNVSGIVNKPTILGAKEQVSIINTVISGTFNISINNGTLCYYTTAASGNFTPNFIDSSDINKTISVGQSLTIVLLTTQGSTAYFCNSLQINGVTVPSGNVYWQGGITPTNGNPNSIDSYTFNIIKISNTPSYTVLASHTRFQ